MLCWRVGLTIKFTKYVDRYEVDVNRVYSGTLEMKEDGYYDWYPSFPSTSGYIPSWVLRAISDKLDELNKDWDEQVEFDAG